jgi:transposase
LRKSSDKGPIPRRLRFGAPQESDFQRLGKNTTRFNPAGNRSKARFEVARIVVGFESGRDGFWIARALQQRGLQVYVMHAASIAVERRGRRAKTQLTASTWIFC